MKKVKVSVIIPAYNVEDFIDKCLDSVLNQTFKDYEIIVVNDGSTDNTLKILRQYEKKYDNISVFDVPNGGQGKARNFALNKSKGDYILFLDSDDFIESRTLELTVNKIEEEKSDLVVFDWKYYNNNENKYNYVNKADIFQNKILKNKECIKLFGIPTYFTVNKLYSYNFLKKNLIKYGEKYIYEDVSFWIKVCIHAKTVSIIHSPLYNIRVNSNSTTKSNLNTDKHWKGYLCAIEESMIEIKKYSDLNYSSLLVYFLKKFVLYYRKRTPFKDKIKFMKKFLDLLNTMLSYDIRINYTECSLPVKYLLKYKIISKKRLFMFWLLFPMLIINKIRRIPSRLKHEYKISREKKFKKKNIANKNNILFMGFDYRYTGNSRYLFEYFVKSKTKNIYFVTNSNLVSEKYRVAPKSKEMYKLLAKSKIVIFESWIPKKFIKPNNAKWIQLFHGTPIKQMLFDSCEAEILRKNKNHKINKYNDIINWDYLLSDSLAANDIFSSAFLIQDDKLLNYGYPRVKYLIDNKNNEKLKSQIRSKINIEKDKKIVLYLPTWRDYNYGQNTDKYDFDYFIDANELQNKLGRDYCIVSKNHSFLNIKNNDKISNVDIETQELLLVADYLISDYSSVIFDAFAINVPVILYTKDFEKYSESRGVYKKMWNSLEPLCVNNTKLLTKKIKDYKIDTMYKQIKSKYSYKNIYKNELGNFILDLLKEDL